MDDSSNLDSTSTDASTDTSGLDSSSYDPTTLDPTPAATAPDPVVSAVFWLIILVVSIVGLVAMWRIFTKAGKPGWAAIIPLYNAVVLLQIVGRPFWFLLLLFVPFANIVVAALVAIDLAKSFGRSTAFGLLLNFLFAPIGQLIIGLGGSQYVGPQGMGGGAGGAGVVPTVSGAPVAAAAQPQSPQVQPAQPQPTPPSNQTPPPPTPPAAS
jgi:membrane-bound ClpP family serine protease